MKIVKTSNDTYNVHLDRRQIECDGLKFYAYPTIEVASLRGAMLIIRETAKPKRVVFIHLLPRTWWAVKF